MVTKIKALIDCAVVAGTEVHSFKAGDIAGIEMTEAEVTFSVDRGDIEVLGAQSSAKAEPVEEKKVVEGQVTTREGNPVTTKSGKPVMIKNRKEEKRTGGVE
jgi:hypothetical protein